MGLAAVMTDHGSSEPSRAVIEAAVQKVIGVAPTVLDAREFMTGGGGRVCRRDAGLLVCSPSAGVLVADVVVVYDVRPEQRERFAATLGVIGRQSVTGSPHAWRHATDKAETVRCLRAAGVAHPETTRLAHTCSAREAGAAWCRLGCDAWARPVTGHGGRDVVHVTTSGGLAVARDRFAVLDTDWLLSRDAGNLDEHGRRHQYRVVVLDDRVLRFVEHVHHDHLDAPLNETHGAVSITRRVGELSAHCRDLAVAAVRALGLRFGGVDLVPEHGGAVIEVNVHPTLCDDARLDTVAIPYVRAHLRRTGTHVAPGRPLGPPT